MDMHAGSTDFVRQNPQIPRGSWRVGRLQRKDPIKTPEKLPVQTEISPEPQSRFSEMLKSFSKRKLFAELGKLLTARRL
ncbi:MAG: hypothetical protein ACI4WY_11560 [Anaerovoracaceae bacterium]